MPTTIMTTTSCMCAMGQIIWLSVLSISPHLILRTVLSGVNLYHSSFYFQETGSLEMTHNFPRLPSWEFTPKVSRSKNPSTYLLGYVTSQANTDPETHVISLYRLCVSSLSQSTTGPVAETTEPCLSPSSGGWESELKVSAALAPSE